MYPKNEVFNKAGFTKKKLFALSLAVFMVLSVFVVLTTVTQPVYAASGSISLDPTVFSHSSTSTVVLANGGTFGSGTTVKFYASSSTTFTSSNTVIGTYSLPSGTTTLSNVAVTFNPSLLAAGSWYVAASDDSGTTFTSSTPITVSTLNPSITLSKTSVTPGTSVTATGSGFDTGSTIAMYLNYPSGTVLISSFSASSLSSGVTFTVPTNIPGSSGGVTYYVVAQESSSSSTNYGITADKTFTLTPSVSISPLSISGSTSSSFTVTGHGFPASDSFSASTSGSPVPTIQFAGVDALNPSFATDSTGTFTVTVTGLSAAISLSTYNGPQQVSVKDATPTTYSNVGTLIVSQPDSATLGFTFSVTATTGSTYNVNDTFVATVWDFPASQSTSFWFGPTEVGTLTTDSNGAGQLTSSIPPLAGGSYTPVAQSSAYGITTSPTSGTSSYVVTGFFQAVDPSGTALISGTSSTGEYIPSTGLVTIQAYGLNPTTTTYDFYDSLVATSGSGSGIGATGLVTTVKVGTESPSTGEFQPASNGTLIFTYSPDYTSTSTGTAGSITSANSVAGYDSNTYAYYVIGTASISTPTSYNIIQSSSTGQGLTFSGLIPYTAALYPGVTNQYNAYVGSTEMSLKFTNHNGISTSGTVFDTGDTSFSFSAPSLSGLFDLNITYNGQPVGTSSVGSQPIVLSLAGSSPSDGTLVVASTSTSGTYEVVGYGYEATSSLSLYYTTYGSTPSSHKTTHLTTYGAFVQSITPGSEPAGTYSVFSVITSSGVNYYQYSSYTVSSSLALDSSTSPSGTVGSSVTVSTTGLVTTPGYYALYFGTQFIEYSSSGATFSSFNVPAVPEGSYVVSIEPVGSMSTVASHTFKVKANSHITLSTSSQYAFPGELVQFTVTGMDTPNFPSEFTAGSSPSYTVTVNLNGTPFETVSAYLPSSGKLTGSFLMPNNVAGSYYQMTFWGNETVSGTFTIGTTAPTTGYATLTEPFQNSQSNYLGLVPGNGALVVGVTDTQLAEIDASINSTLTVPLSQLNAAVSSINGDMATITTDFGTMSATLSSINATIYSINLGVVDLETTLGQVKTSLASLNSTVVALNNDTATISTDVGVYKTTLNNINATVTISKGNIATIQTDLGTFTGNVTSVSNGIATIQTSLGTIKTNTNQLVPSYGTSFLLEIIILVLVVIAVVFSALAMKNTRKKF